MRALSATRFLPPQTQLECVMKDHRTHAEALTLGGDHCTPCTCCSHPNAHCKDCFWVLKTFDFSLKGHEFKVNQGEKQRGAPLPLPAIHHRREFLYLRCP